MARALPPFSPPALPRATALALFSCSSGVGSQSSICPVVISISLPSFIGSRGRLRRRSAIRRPLYTKEIMIVRTVSFVQKPTATFGVKLSPFSCGRVHPFVSIDRAAFATHHPRTLFPSRHAGNMARRPPIGNPASRARRVCYNESDPLPMRERVCLNSDRSVKPFRGPRSSNVLATTIASRLCGRDPQQVCGRTPYGMKMITTGHPLPPHCARHPLPQCGAQCGRGGTQPVGLGG